MSADFRQLAIKGLPGKAERLFRAAISAYCSLVRPSRREAAQLDDLALPLYAAVPPVARRFAAAALSECTRIPPLLVRRLCDEPVDICAPLLVRSAAIGDVDLIALIGRHGLPHARAIARRPALNPVIADLLGALKDPEIRRLRSGKPRPALHAVPSPAAPPPPAEAEALAENVRHRLRSMMRPASDSEAGAPPAAENSATLFERLRETALSGHPPLFQTALADALGIDLDAARRLTGRDSYRELCAALCRLGLAEEQAFMLVVALFPAVSDSPESIRLFLYCYRLSGENPAAAPAVPELLPEPIRRAS